MPDWRNFLSPQPTNSDDILRIVYRNGVDIGEAVRDVDGYWKYVFSAGQGFWEEAHLHMIADMLHDFNRDWDEEVRKFFEQEGTDDG